VYLRILPNQAAAIDAWINRQEDAHLTRPDVIRCLLKGALAQRPKSKTNHSVRNGHMAADITAIRQMVQAINEYETKNPELGAVLVKYRRLSTT
jgi:hypothetical protein